MRKFLGPFLFTILLSAFVLGQSAPVAFLSQLYPDTIAPGHAQFQLTISGAGFKTGAVVNWNGSPRTTTVVSVDRLEATITAADVAHAGAGSVTVINPGSFASNVIYFPIHHQSAQVAFARQDLVLGGQAANTAIGDFNGDGKPDMIAAIGVSAFGSGSLEVFLGNGNGTFSAPISTSLYNPGNDLVVADFNGDGKLDVLAVDDYGDGSVMLGNGDGTFSQGPFITEFPDENFVAVGDFNRDGKLDLFLAGGGDGDYFVQVFLGNGDGSFTLSTQDLGYIDNPQRPVIGDFNRDGKLDVALPDVVSGSVRVFLGKGDGTFAAGVSYVLAHPPVGSVVADVDGDGKLDIVSDGMSVLLGNGDGTFTPGAAVSQAGFYPLAGDFNNDGKIDVITGYSNLSLLLGNGDGSFQSPVSWYSGNYALPGGAADFDGDGRLDAIALDTSVSGASVVSVFLQTNLNITPTSLNFGYVKVGTTSAPQTSTLTNIGTGALTLGAISLSGTSGFAQTNDCGSTLAAGASCTISVTFTPHVKMAYVKPLRIGYSGTIGSPQYIELFGSGD